MFDRKGPDHRGRRTGAAGRGHRPEAALDAGSGRYGARRRSVLDHRTRCQLHQITERLKAKKIAVQRPKSPSFPEHGEGGRQGREAPLALIEALEEMDDVAKVSANFDIDAEGPGGGDGLA